MALMRTANPALNSQTFAGAGNVSADEAMTLQGTVNRTGILLALLVAASVLAWSQGPTAKLLQWTGIWAIAGFVVGLFTVFVKKAAPITAPVYAVLEGLVVGGISLFFELQYPGIVIQAVALTFGTLAALLIVYTSRLIPVTQNFRLGVVAATGGIAILYLVDLGMGFFLHRSIPMIHESGLFGIGFSIFVVIIAALNLVLDFDFIENGSRTGQPKYMEWYAGFGLIVTLVWLYLEILRLLAKTRRRR